MTDDEVDEMLSLADADGDGNIDIKGTLAFVHTQGKIRSFPVPVASFTEVPTLNLAGKSSR